VGEPCHVCLEVVARELNLSVVAPRKRRQTSGFLLVKRQETRFDCPWDHHIHMYNFFFFHIYIRLHNNKNPSKSKINHLPKDRH